MKELWEFTKLIRSKNAGPFELTFDIMFKDAACFDQVMKSGALSAEAIAELYKTEPGQVQFFVIKQLLTVKISMPRRVFSGDMRDTDVYGGEVFGPPLFMPLETGKEFWFSTPLSVPLPVRAGKGKQLIHHQ